MNNTPPKKKQPTLLLQVDKVLERISFLQSQRARLPDATLQYRSGPRDPAVLVFESNLKGRIEELENLIK